MSADLADDMAAASGGDISKKRKIDCHENAPVI